MTWTTCARPGCTHRAHVLLGGERVCWGCFNEAARKGEAKGARMLRRYYR